MEVFPEPKQKDKAIDMLQKIEGNERIELQDSRTNNTDFINRKKKTERNRFLNELFLKIKIPVIGSNEFVDRTVPECTEVLGVGERTPSHNITHLEYQG